MRNDCTVGKLSERNEADDEEVIRRCNRSCVFRVGVICPELELEMDGPLTDIPYITYPIVPIHILCYRVAITLLLFLHILLYHASLLTLKNPFSIY